VIVNAEKEDDQLLEGIEFLKTLQNGFIITLFGELCDNFI
jgi:hypothetical protein